MTSMLLAPLPVAPPGLRRVRYEPEPGCAPDPPVPLHRHPPAVRVPSETDRAQVRRALAPAVRLAMEVLDGRRPVNQLDGHFDAGPTRYWRAAARQRRMRSPARVLRLRLSLPHQDAAELTAVCDIDGRVRALAARFDRTHTHAPWRCTALRLG